MQKIGGRELANRTRRNKRGSKRCDANATTNRLSKANMPIPNLTKSIQAAPRLHKAGRCRKRQRLASQYWAGLCSPEPMLGSVWLVESYVEDCL